MIKRFLCLLVILCIFCLGSVKHESNNIRPQFVKIEVIYKQGERSGTGVFVKDNIILTARHMLENAKSIDVIYPDGRCIAADQWYKEKVDIADIGIITIKTPEIEPNAVFVDAILEQDVKLCGAPLRFFPVVTKGIVSAINMEIDTTMFGTCKVFMIDAAGSPGSSGSPIFDNDNRIVGIFVGYFYGGNDLNIAIPAKNCVKFLNRILKNASHRKRP